MFLKVNRMRPPSRRETRGGGGLNEHIFQEDVGMRFDVRRQVILSDGNGADKRRGIDLYWPGVGHTVCLSRLTPIGRVTNGSAGRVRCQRQRKWVFVKASFHAVLHRGDGTFPDQRFVIRLTRRWPAQIAIDQTIPVASVGCVSELLRKLR